VVHLLLEHGADAGAVEKRGNTTPGDLVGHIIIITQAWQWGGSGARHVEHVFGGWGTMRCPVLNYSWCLQADRSGHVDIATVLRRHESA
jgi:hypothetical protein